MQYAPSEAYKHHCTLVPLSEQKKDSWVGFAYFMEENEAKIECFPCFQLEQNCVVHQKINHDLLGNFAETKAQVNLISFAYQTNTVFKTHIFKDEQINISSP